MTEPTHGERLPAQSYQAALRASFDNAKALRLDARLLFKAKSYGRSAALAVMGNEEVGKVVFYFLELLQRVRPEASGALLKILRFDHATKQAASLVGRLIGDVERRVRPAFARLAMKGPATLEGLEALMIEAMPAIVSAVAPLSDDEINREVREVYEEKKLQFLKHRGLFVDLLADGSVSDPRDVRRSDAARAIRELGLGLRGVRFLVAPSRYTPEALELLVQSTKRFPQDLPQPTATRSGSTANGPEG